MLIFRRLPLSPADISIPEPFDAPRNVQENFVELLAKQEAASVYAKDQLATYKKKMKEYYDTNKATDRQVSVGDIVYVYQPNVKTPKTRKKTSGKISWTRLQ